MRTQRGAAWAARCNLGSWLRFLPGATGHWSPPRRATTGKARVLPSNSRPVSPDATRSQLRPVATSKKLPKPEAQPRPRASNLGGARAFRVRLERLLRKPEAMENDGEFSGYRHNGFAFTAFAAALG